MSGALRVADPQRGADLRDRWHREGSPSEELVDEMTAWVEAELKANGGMAAIAARGDFVLEDRSGLVTAELLRDLATQRVVDVRNIFPPLMAAASGTIDRWTPPAGDQSDWWVEGDLPLVSPPRVGLQGWWQLDDTVAAMVLQHGDGADEHGVLVMAGTITPEGLCSMIVAQSMGLIRADGQGWGVSARLPDGISRGDEIAEDVRPVVDASIAVLLACSIAQGDPDVVVTRATPPRLARAAARRGRPKPVAVTSIDLPGLRFDGASGRFSATRSSGAPWHMVRGHWRRLTSATFTHKQGQQVWIRPHSRGHEDNGTSTRGYRVTKETRS